MDINKVAEIILQMVIASVGMEKRLEAHFNTFENRLSISLWGKEGQCPNREVPHLIIISEGSSFKESIKDAKEMIKSHCDIDPETFGL